MIRNMRTDDIDAVAAIWLDTNIRAHGFISSQYWKDQFKVVKEMLLDAELYVYEQEKEIKGFIGLDGNYIAGIFVKYGAQSKGTGRQLLDFVKRARDKLILNVYQKNERAVEFYQREGFTIQYRQTDKATGEAEYLMLWEE